MGIPHQVTEPRIPERIFINLPPVFASLLFTIPHLQVDLPENPTLAPKGDLSVTILNNEYLKRDPGGYNGLSGNNLKANTTIESVNWKGQIIPGQQLIQERKQLLNHFFVDSIGSEEAVSALRQHMKQTGLQEGSYLYRAISDSELRELQNNGYRYVSHLDPSANFENEKMFSGEHSQVKHYAERTQDGYSGRIIRWKTEDPLLYRTAGMAVRRIIPMFSHYLPQEIEISNKGGITFEVLTPQRKGDVSLSVTARSSPSANEGV